MVYFDVNTHLGPGVWNPDVHLQDCEQVHITSECLSFFTFFSIFIVFLNN